MGSSEQKSGTERSEGSNFAFLQRSEPLFFQLGSTAERLFSFDPNAYQVILQIDSAPSSGVLFAAPIDELEAMQRIQSAQVSRR